MYEKIPNPKQNKKNTKHTKRKICNLRGEMDDLNVCTRMLMTLQMKDDPENIISGMELVDLEIASRVVRVFELRGYQKHQDQKDQRLSRIGSGVLLYSPEESGVEDASFDKFCGADDPSSSKDMFPISIISSNADLSAEKVTASIISVESTNQHNLTCKNI